jgi:hypothetical protein
VDADGQSKADPEIPETREHLVNGDSAEQSASEDVSSQHAFGDASGGSDTDISRPGSVDPAKDHAIGHVRSNSVKKPAASFKSVSVTKNFLAKSAVATPTARIGDKVAPGSQNNAPTLQTLKPRLVAKSGSGMGNLTRSLAKTNGTGSGPDASKVWNKNQPVPLPPPKQFTDEELKQQYGIHLATRLQADESGKEAKWADIDDDEDDWAPDPVQWMDGTKSTVAAVENQPPPPEEPKLVVAKEVPAEPTKRPPTPVTISQRPNSTTGTKTILKPGAHAQTGSTKSGLVAKGQSDKPTLVAKPSTTAPVKSPWATLPPVEKVLPLLINSSVQQPPQSRFSQRETQSYDAMPPPPGPAKEIAPDDFNRSWRDDRGNRELFNSHSGRYEPVPEMRRGSVRDNHRQQPSVLQRPSHDGPAEPSAAFQTSRTSADGPAWGHRRNSSNLSGDSGRRMSIDKRAPELHPISMNAQPRGPQSVNGPESTTPGRPAFGSRSTLTESQHAVPEQHPQWAPKPSPSISQAQPVSPLDSVDSSAVANSPVPSVPTPVPVENPVEVQNRLMREKIERAKVLKLRQREAEEKEEAERKERIRKKLEAMGMGTDTKPKLKEQSPSRSDEKSPQKDKAVPAPVQSPPKPPMPTSEGEVAQYGMMKVHQSQPVKKANHSDPATSKTARSAEHAPKPSPSPVKAQTENQPRPVPSLTELPPPPSSTFTRENRKSPSDVVQAPLPQSDSETRTNIQPIKAAQPPQAVWSTPLPQQSRPWASNVWGPPQAKDRALGNGTFDSGYNRNQSHPGGQPLPSPGHPNQPPPLGLNPPLKPSASQAPVAPKQPFVQTTMFAQSETLPAQQTNAVAKPGPIAPPVDKGWGNFAAAIRQDDQAMVVKARQNFERMGGETFRPEIRETYTDQQGKSQTTVHSKISGNATLDKNGIKPELNHVAPVELRPKDSVSKPVYTNATSENDVGAPNGQVGHLQSTSQSARASRFFPRHSEASNLPLSISGKSDSPPPPPPETESHPAFTSDSEHPVVRMPKPSPRVRLPPAATEPTVAPEAPVSMPSRTRLGLGARPLALDPEWQARFNSLLEKSPPAVVSVPVSKPLPVNHVAPPKSGALAVAASTKAPLEVRAGIASATVSLPNATPKKTFAVDNSNDITTRVCAEEALLEEREFGSLPVVKPPKVSYLAANEPSVGFPPSRPNSKFQKFDCSSKEAFDISDIEASADSIDIKVRLEHMRVAVTKSLARRRDHRKASGYKGPKRNFTPNGVVTGPGNQRQRKPSNYQGPSANSSTSPRTSGGSGWNRSTQSQHNNNHNNTWARHAAAPVH